MKEENFHRTFGVLLFISLIWSARLLAADVPVGGKVVWWGRDHFGKGSTTDHTNGVIENDNEILTNIVSVTAAEYSGFLITTEGTVLKVGRDFANNGAALSSLTNVASITTVGDWNWVIKRDGTVTRLGGESSSDDIVGLSNVIAIARADGGYLALREDGAVLGFFLESDRPGRRLINTPTGTFVVSDSIKLANGALLEAHRTTPVPNDTTNLPVVPPQPVRIGNHVLNGIAGIDYPFLLKKDGAVIRLNVEGVDPYLGSETFSPPFYYQSTNPALVNGTPLTNVVRIIGSDYDHLALKEDGTILSWRGNGPSVAATPWKLSNVVAIAAHSLALKQDGTVVEWGNNFTGKTSVPAGLSNVIAIAAGRDFSMAITTGNIPSSVYITPHGRLEEMEREADLVFKGQVISSRALTNAAFPDWAKPHATEFRIISLFKGSPQTNVVTFLHITGRPMAGSGRRPPQTFLFDSGQSYVIYAMRADKKDWLYAPASNSVTKLNEFRQIMTGEIPIRTLDNRSLDNLSAKGAHWVELNLLLKDANITNQLYAINLLDRMSFAHRGDDEWAHSDDFKRSAVLTALLPMTTNSDEEIANRAINCFVVASNAVAILEPFAASLIQVANNGPSANRGLNAISALSGTHFEAISNSLAQLLNDTNANVRASAVGLLSHYPGAFSERALRERAVDDSPSVRAAVADVIGGGKIEILLPTLVKLFTDPVGLTNPNPPLSIEDVQAGGRANIQGDVHYSTGFALLNFDVVQVAEILKTNISDRGFCLSFIRKLAPNGAEPYFPIMAQELRAHTARSEQEAATNGFHWPLSYWLIGNYGWAWDTLFAYVSRQSRESLAAPRMAPILDALQIADDPSEDRTRSLYEFFLDKGMIERAKELRRGIIRRTEDKNINKESFGFPEKLKAFDKMDEKHSLKPGLGL